MKTALTFMLLVGLLHQNVDGQNTNLAGKLEQFLMSRCQRVSTDVTTYDTFRQGVDSFKQYFKLSVVRIDADPEGFCEDNRYNLKETMKELTKALRPCFVKEEAFLPDFVRDSFSAFLDFLCVDNSHNYKTFNSTLGKNCRNKMTETNGVGEVHDCFELKLFGAIGADGVVHKKGLCEDISTAERCFNNALAKSCPNFPAFDKLYKDFFASVSKPCSASSTIMSSGLMILALYFATKFVF